MGTTKQTKGKSARSSGARGRAASAKPTAPTALETEIRKQNASLAAAREELEYVRKLLGKHWDDETAKWECDYSSGPPDSWMHGMSYVQDSCNTVAQRPDPPPGIVGELQRLEEAILHFQEVVETLEMKLGPYVFGALGAKPVPPQPNPPAVGVVGVETMSPTEMRLRAQSDSLYRLTLRIEDALQQFRG